MGRGYAFAGGSDYATYFLSLTADTHTYLNFKITTMSFTIPGKCILK